MKLPPAKTDQFIKNPDPHIKGVLIYGPDSGLVSLRRQALHQTFCPDTKDPFLNAHLSYKAIKKDPALLADELYASSLIGGKRCIRIDDSDATILADISEILKSYQGDNVFIWTASELPPSSSLRKLFEGQDHLVAIACYQDDSTSLKQVIMHYIKEKKYNATIEAIDLLSHRFSGDRMVVIQELEKLFLYKGAHTHINADDVLACSADAVELSLDQLCHAVASGNNHTIDRFLKQAFEENVAAITIIRTLAYYFMRLHVVHAVMETGEPLTQAITKLRPPVFFKHIPLFKQHCMSWSKEALGHMLCSLYKLEQECKSSFVAPELRLAQFLSLIPQRYKISA